MERIDFDPDELEVAEQWHGGQESMLYAIVSTGSLKRSTFERCRPHHDCTTCDGEGFRGSPSDYIRCPACNGSRRGLPYTDDQWLAQIASKLEAEAESCARDARERAKRAKHARRRDEQREMSDHAEKLDGIANKCRIALVALDGGIVS